MGSRLQWFGADRRRSNVDMSDHGRADVQPTSGSNSATDHSSVRVGVSTESEATLSRPPQQRRASLVRQASLGVSSFAAKAITAGRRGSTFLRRGSMGGHSLFAASDRVRKSLLEGSRRPKSSVDAEQRGLLRLEAEVESCQKEPARI